MSQQRTPETHALLASVPAEATDAFLQLASDKIAPSPEQLQEQAERDEFSAQLQAELDRLDAGELADTPEKIALFKYVRLRSRLVAERDRVAEQTAAMVRALDSRIDQLDYLNMLAAADTTKKLIAGGKAKSYKTPYGTVGFRTKAGSLEVVDDAEVILATAEGRLPEGVTKAELKIVKSVLNDHFKTTGEVPPGCEVREPSETFYVK